MFKYVYWSDRAVDAFVNDNGMKKLERDISFKSPTLAGLAPEVGVTQRRLDSRMGLSKSILRKLGKRAETDLTANKQDPHYIRGRGFISFGQFVAGDGDPLGALMFTRLSASDGSRIVVCMFGSLDGFPGYVTEAGTSLLGGWTSSAWATVKRFIDNGCTHDIEIWGNRYSESEISFYAYQVASGQGLGRGGAYPWNRGYTFGDVNSSGEWLLEVYYDAHRNYFDLDDQWYFDSGNYDRILIGRPLWVRTPIERNIRLYGRYSREERQSWSSPLRRQRAWPEWFGR
jgi:hypothetical protein